MSRSGGFYVSVVISLYLDPTGALVRAENVIRSRDLDERIEAGEPSVDDLAVGFAGSHYR